MEQLPNNEPIRHIDQLAEAENKAEQDRHKLLYSPHFRSEEPEDSWRDDLPDMNSQFDIREGENGYLMLTAGTDFPSIELRNRLFSDPSAILAILNDPKFIMPTTALKALIQAGRAGRENVSPENELALRQSEAEMVHAVSFVDTFARLLDDPGLKKFETSMALSMYVARMDAFRDTSTPVPVINRGSFSTREHRIADIIEAHAAILFPESHTSQYTPPNSAGTEQNSSTPDRYSAILAEVADTAVPRPSTPGLQNPLDEL